MLDPISYEELDINGYIHRYNFGWLLSETIVGGSPSGGLVVENTTTMIAGTAGAFNETLSQSILPPSIDMPAINGISMNSGIVVGSYSRVGSKKRTYTRNRVFGTSELIVMGESQFAVGENKIYADAIGGGGTEVSVGGGVLADGGAQITAANGVMTITEIKG